MRWADPVHRFAKALNGRQRTDVLVRVGVGHAIDEVRLGADGPSASRRCAFDGFDNELRAPREVRPLHDIPIAFGVDQNGPIRLTFAKSVALAGGEKLMDAAMSLPQDKPRVPGLIGRQPAVRFMRIVERHALKRIAHGVSCIATEVLIR